ncbi:MAG: patatin-like phospholipase family protein [Spirochaetes bacterium]|jgi:NTE family protein|nr:patatin-like phospholipase family protein [Spirochaetota bacterium]
MSSIRLSTFFTILAIILSFSKDSFAENTKAKRPKIGLVLSGGGAKGLAHIGVLKVIEECGLKIDYISGTSMGSIVGGLYAIGYDAGSLEKLARVIDWEDLIGDQVSRDSLSIDEKDDHDKYIGSFPLKKWSIELPKGLIRGQKLTTMLSRLTIQAQSIKEFADYPIPFLCIATDIETGKAVVLKNGYLPDALRASMSIPSVFTPIEIDGKLLVDGGVVRNLPVSDARKMGADIIIAVDVGSPLYKKNEITSIAEVMDQSVSFLGAKSTREERKLTDILILPDINGYNATNFQDAEKLIQNGEKAAREFIPKLIAMAEEQKKFAIEKKKELSISCKIYIKEVRIEGLNKVSENLVLGKFLVPIPALVSPEELEEGINRIYASQFFDRVTYELNWDENGYVLKIRVIENTATFLKLGFSYDSDMRAGIMVNTTFRNLLGQGSKLAVDARLSEYPGLKLSYFIHSGWRKPGIGLGTSLEYNRFNFYSYKNKDVKGSYNFNEISGDMIVQAVIYNSIALGAGLQKNYNDINSIVSVDEPNRRDIESLNYYCFINVDTLDSTFYPKSGFRLYGEARYYTDDFPVGKSFGITSIGRSTRFESFQKYTAKSTMAVPVHKKVSVFLNLAGSAVVSTDRYSVNVDKTYGLQVYKKEIPFVYKNYLGGLYTYKNEYFPFAGLSYMQVNGKNAAMAQIGVQIEPWKDKFLIFRGNAGKAGYYLSTVFNMKSLIYGCGVTFGMNSIIGPIELSILYGSVKKNVLFNVNIGYRL